MKKKKYFAHTQKPINLYGLLISSSMKDAQRKIKKKLVRKRLIYSNIPSFQFILFFLKCLFSLKLFNKTKILYLEYRNCELGMHASAVTYRELNTWRSNFICYKELIRNLFVGSAIIDYAYSIVNDCDAIFIDHGGYLHGLYYKIFAENKKIVYTMGSPRGLYTVDFRHKKNQGSHFFRDSIRFLKSKQKVSKKIIEKNKKQINKSLLDPNKYISWMTTCPYENLDKDFCNYKKIDYVLYAHSFTDGQLWFGNDGFYNLYDWTVFTLDELVKNNKNVIVKGHPNFFNDFRTKYVPFNKLDRDIFFEIKKKYQSKKIIFLDAPVKNNDLLKKISKKTILVSHHGTALTEGNFKGFKTISSKATMWEPRLKITNSWASKQEYVDVLNKEWKELKSSNKNDFFDYVNQLYFNPYRVFRKLSWQQIIFKHYHKKINKDEYVSSFSNETSERSMLGDILSDPKRERKIINEMSTKIEEIYIN